MTFKRGTNLPGNTVTTQTFTQDSPLIGLNGYTTSTKIYGLGLIRYNCTTVVISPNETNQTVFTNQTDSESIVTTVIASTTVSITVIVVSVLATLFVMSCCLCVVAFLIVRKGLFKKNLQKLKLNKVDNMDDLEGEEIS